MSKGQKKAAGNILIHVFEPLYQHFLGKYSTFLDMELLDQK